MAWSAFLSTPEEILAFSALVLFSLADLRYRTLPGVRIFFLAAVLFGLAGDPLKCLAVLLAVGWGRFPRWSVWVILPALLNLAAWPVLLVGAGVRRKWISQGDLLVIGGIACLFSGAAPVLALVGVVIWRGWWRRRWAGMIPASPGMFLGLLAYIGFLN